MGDISVGLGCPSCGGVIQIAEDSKAVNCQYCNALLWVEGEKGVRTIIFQNRFDGYRAQDIVRVWFKKGLKARDLQKSASVVESYEIYLPFWKLVARAAGWVCGYEERTTVDSRGNTRTERIYKEQMVFRDFERTMIACDTGDIGIRYLRNTVGEVIPTNPSDVPTFEVTTSSTDAEGKLSEFIRDDAVKSANIPYITFQKMHIIPRIFTLIYYPVWVVRFNYQGRIYFATVDGVTGNVLSGRAPGDPLYQSMIMTLGSAGGGIIAGLAIAFSSSYEIILVGLLVGLTILAGSYMFFRHGSEIVEGDIAAEYKKGYQLFKDFKRFGSGV